MFHVSKNTPTVTAPAKGYHEACLSNSKLIQQ